MFPTSAHACPPPRLLEIPNVSPRNAAHQKAAEVRAVNTPEVHQIPRHCRGAHAGDGRGVGTDTAEVRAQRNGNPKTPGNGRVYRITFTATDDKGAACTATVTVCFLYDQAAGSTCVDDNDTTTFDSTVTGS